jgi:hypothetical protein
MFRAHEEAGGTQWTVSVDRSQAAIKAGQAAVQVSATTAAGLRTRAVASFSGLLCEDGFFVSTTRVADPATGEPQLVVAGAIDPRRVATVSVAGPEVSRDVALGAMPPAEDSYAGFLTLYDGAVTRVDDLVLVIAFVDGTQEMHAVPSQVNVRSSSGARL